MRIYLNFIAAFFVLAHASLLYERGTYSSPNKDAVLDKATREVKVISQAPGTDPKYILKD